MKTINELKKAFLDEKELCIKNFPDWPIKHIHFDSYNPTRRTIIVTCIKEKFHYHERVKLSQIVDPCYKSKI